VSEIGDDGAVSSAGDPGLHRDLTTTVGGTPLVQLSRLGKGLPGRVAAKLEMRNPCGSVCDAVQRAREIVAERADAIALDQARRTSHPRHRCRLHPGRA